MIALLLFVALACLAVVSAEFVRMESSINVFASPKWRHDKIVAGDEPVNAIFVLKMDSQKIAAFEKNLLEISNPKNSRYGQYMKLDEIKARIAPAEENVKKVVDFLKASGVAEENIRISKLGDKVHVKMPAKTAATMLKTEFAQFRSVITPSIAITRVTQPYFLPAEIAGVVSLVDDIVRFPSVREPMIQPLKASDTTDPEFNSCGTTCAGFTTPSVLETAYSFSALTTANAGNSVSVAEFQGQYWDQTDLTNFNTICDVDGSVTTTIGGNNPSACSLTGCTEAMLDIEYIAAITNPIPLTVLYSSTYSLLTWVDDLIAMTNPTLVNSVSYGNDEVQQTSTEYMDSVNTQFMAAGSLGLSILFASGDQGVWGRTGYSKTATFHPDFPAGSPYVTAVGGTNFVTKSVIGAEEAWNCGGGGFSNTFAMPSWQTDVVEAYLTNAAAQGVLPSASLFNATGRAYPDVAALGGQTNPYCVTYRGGRTGGVAGTSASCPVVAGIFAQLNDLRLNAGKAPLGWLNPFIYQNSQCFNDVTSGTNNCQAGTAGFTAIAGWDPATGFGSPNFQCLSGIV